MYELPNECVYVCRNLCMYVYDVWVCEFVSYFHACPYVYIYACMHMNISIYACMYVSKHV